MPCAYFAHSPTSSFNNRRYPRRLVNGSMHHGPCRHGGRLSVILYSNPVPYPRQYTISYGPGGALETRLRYITYIPSSTFMFVFVSRRVMQPPYLQSRFTVAGSGGLRRAPCRAAPGVNVSSETSPDLCTSASDGRRDAEPAAMRVSDEAVLATLERSGIILDIWLMANHHQFYRTQTLLWGSQQDARMR